MKKIIFSLIILISLLLITFSCSSDDDEPNQNVELTGTWQLTAFTTESTSDINQDGNSTSDFMAETNNCYADSILVFKTDNTVDSSGSYADIEIDVEINNGNETYTISTSCENDGTTETYNWTQSNNEITVTGIGVGVLSGNTLTFTIPSGYLLPSIDGGVEAHTLTDITQVFTKQ